MGSAQQWEPGSEAAELLAIKHRTLGTMRRDDRLTPGDHIIFATATTGGPVVYNVNAIRGSLAQRSKESLRLICSVVSNKNKPAKPPSRFTAKTAWIEAQCK